MYTSWHFTMLNQQTKFTIKKQFSQTMYLHKFVKLDSYLCISHKLFFELEKNTIHKAHNKSFLTSGCKSSPFSGNWFKRPCTKSTFCSWYLHCSSNWFWHLASKIEENSISSEFSAMGIFNYGKNRFWLTSFSSKDASIFTYQNFIFKVLVDISNSYSLSL